MNWWRRVVKSFKVGAWAGSQGWSPAKGARCPTCGGKMYVRGGDFACASELFYRWERRSGSP